MLPTRATVAGLSVPMPCDNDLDANVEGSIHNRVRTDPQRKTAATLRGRCSEAWVGYQELRDSLEFAEKPASYH